MTTGINISVFLADKETQYLVASHEKAVALNCLFPWTVHSPYKNNVSVVVFFLANKIITLPEIILFVVMSVVDGKREERQSWKENILHNRKY